MTAIMTRPNPIGTLWQNVKAAVSPILSFTSQSWSASTPTYTAAKYDNYVREGYLKCELIFACINARADTAASIALKVYDAKTHEELPDHPLRKLLARPNPFISEHDFWRSVITNLDLAGWSPYQKIRGNGGQVTQLWNLRPDGLSIRRSATEFVDGYSYSLQGNKPTSLNTEDVLLFINRDPRDPLTPVSRAQVAGRIIDVDNALTDYIKLYWEQGGTPPGILTSKLKLMPDQIARARANWASRYGGYRNWQTPVILDSDTTYQQIGSSVKDIGFESLDGRSETRICAVFDVPPIIVGTTIGLARNTFSNFGEARKSWWQDKLTPLYKKLADQIDMDLVPEFGGGVYVKWDMSQVPALQEDQDARWSRATAAWLAGAITRNTFNVQVGLPIEPTGDVFAVPTMNVISPDADSTANDTSDPEPDEDTGKALTSAEFETRMFTLLEKFVQATKPAIKASDPVTDSAALVKKYADEMAIIAAKAARGDITSDEFENQMKELILQSATAQAQLGGELTDADKARISADVEKQYEYLDGFVKALGGMDSGAAATRAAMYANSARSQYWKQASPVKLDAYPQDGSTDCRASCKCSLRFDTDTKPGKCLVTWELGDAKEPCPDCAGYAKAWNPLEVDL